MQPKQKGDLAVANAIQYYMSHGYEVCLPIGDKRPYDLIVEKEGQLKRVQVKYAGLYKTINQHKVALRTMGGNQSFKTAKKYSDDDFDELFAYTASGRKFAIPWVDIVSRNSINIEHQKYKLYEIV